jgi:hypothetical protein
MTTTLTEAVRSLIIEEIWKSYHRDNPVNLSDEIMAKLAPLLEAAEKMRADLGPVKHYDIDYTTSKVTRIPFPYDQARAAIIEGAR